MSITMKSIERGIFKVPLSYQLSVISYQGAVNQLYYSHMILSLKKPK